MTLHKMKKDRDKYTRFIIELAREGFSLRQIADIIGDITHTTINTDLVNAGYLAHKQNHDPTKKFQGDLSELFNRTPAGQS